MTSTSPALTLHIMNGTSGLAPHMALLASGVDFSVRRLDLFKGEHQQPDFLRKNPFGTVPVLEDGALCLPEAGAILMHVAERWPEARLLPAVPDPGRTAAIRWMFHTAALHADFMTWRRATFRFKKDDPGRASVHDWMADRLATAFRATEQAMAGPFLIGETPCVADLYVLMVAGWWRSRFPFAAETPRLTAALTALTALPFVRDAYADEESELPAFA